MDTNPKDNNWTGKGEHNTRNKIKKRKKESDTAIMIKGKLSEKKGKEEKETYKLRQNEKGNKKEN